jgi:hypothetical protein
MHQWNKKVRQCLYFSEELFTWINDDWCDEVLQKFLRKIKFDVVMYFLLFKVWWESQKYIWVNCEIIVQFCNGKKNFRFWKRWLVHSIVLYERRIWINSPDYQYTP